MNQHKNCTSPGNKKWYTRANERQAIPTQTALGKYLSLTRFTKPNRLTGTVVLQITDTQFVLEIIHSNKQKANCNLMLSRGHPIVTSRELMCCYACSWDVRGDLTLNYMAQIHTSVTLLRHVISRGALVGSRANSSHTFLLLHTFREAWPTCRMFLSVFMTVFIVRRDAECS